MKARYLSVKGSGQTALQWLAAHQWLWWGAGGLVLAVAVLLLVLPGQPEQVVIPYSALVEQVRKSNVERIVVRDDRISGVFRVPISWPSAGESIPSSNGLLVMPPASTALTEVGAIASRLPLYVRFSSVIPTALGDGQLLSLLEQYGVIVEASPSSSLWSVSPFVWVLVIFALAGFVLVLRGRSKPDRIEQVTAADEPNEQIEFVALPQVSLADVVGQPEAKQELSEIVALLKNKDASRDLRADLPKGVLLVGFPGTGKTLLAQAAAGGSALPFFPANTAEMVELGAEPDGAQVRDLFRLAVANAPSLVFLDELDALGYPHGMRAGNEYEAQQAIVRLLLAEMDGLSPDHRVIVLAATSRPQLIRPALLRPGRFERQISVSLPTQAERSVLLQRQLQERPLTSDVDLGDIARRTAGLSGSDLLVLCQMAAWAAARFGRDGISKAEFDEALSRFAQFGEARNRLLDRDSRLAAAYHEAGHAILTFLLPGADPLRRLSILPSLELATVPYASVLGERSGYTRTYLLTQLTVMLGGRTAEEIALNEMTTRAESDLEHATRLARHMAARWGMSDLGPVSFSSGELQAYVDQEVVQLPGLSEAAAAQVDRAVRVILEDRHAVARHLLKNNRGLLDRLAEILMREETLQAEQIARLVGKIAPVTSIDEPRASAKPSTK